MKKSIPVFERFLVFEGDANVYAQGEYALTDGKKSDGSEFHTNFLIGHHPELILIDHRELGWEDAEGFNVKSYVEVYLTKNDTTIEIILSKSRSKRKVSKTLVFGVIYDHSIPNYDVVWEVFKVSTVNKDAIPFVTLINN
jgi:hypothetical protein